jgi:hypothetical protein
LSHHAGSGSAQALYPHVTALAQSVSHEGVLGPCDDDAEFAFGLGLILGGLERRRARDSASI